VRPPATEQHGPRVAVKPQKCEAAGGVTRQHACSLSAQAGQAGRQPARGRARAPVTAGRGGAQGGARGVPRSTAWARGTHSWPEAPLQPGSTWFHLVSSAFTNVVPPRSHWARLGPLARLSNAQLAGGPPGHPQIPAGLTCMHKSSTWIHVRSRKFCQVPLKFHQVTEVPPGPTGRASVHWLGVAKAQFASTPSVLRPRAMRKYPISPQYSPLRWNRV
jgi:hypothetical protein